MHLRLKVILLHPFDAFSGSQRVAATLARAIADADLDLDIYLGFGTRGFVSNLPGVRRFMGTNHIPSRKLLYPFWLFVMWPRILLAAIRGEVVWANTVYSIAAALPMLLLAPKRLIVHAHELEFDAITRLLVVYAGSRGANIIGVSRLHVQRLGVRAEVISNCVSVESDVPPDPFPRIIYVGLPSPLKGFPLFIDVARRLPRDKMRLIAYLSDRSSASLSLLKDAEEAGIELIFGRVDPLEIYPGASLLLQCTDASLWTETFSLVMVEALACGVPVGTTGMAVAAEILEDAWAFDVADRDPARIAAEIDLLLDSSERLAALRAAAKIRRKCYTFERFKVDVSSLILQVAKVGVA